MRTLLAVKTLICRLTDWVVSEMAKTAAELALEEQARAAQEAYRIALIRQLGFDPTGIDRSTMNNMKDLEGVIGGRIGSGQVVNPESFAPTVSTETMQLPAAPFFDSYLSAPEGSIEKSAFDIFDEEGQTRFSAEDRLDILLEAEHGKLKDDDQGWDAYVKDRDRHQSILTQLFDEEESRRADIAKMGPEAQAADAAGQLSYSSTTSTPSKAAQSYYDDGLYLPTDKYTKDMFFRESSADNQGGRVFDGGVGSAESARQQYMDILKARGDISVRDSAPVAPPGVGGFSRAGRGPQMRNSPVGPGGQTGLEAQQASAAILKKAALSRENAGLDFGGRAAGTPQWKQDRSGWTNADAASATASVAGRRSRDDLRRAEEMLAAVNRAGRTPYQDQISMQMGQY